MKQLGYMPFSEYKAIPALSKSDLVHLAESPLHFKMRQPIEMSDEMRLGVLIHTALLEPSKLKGSYLLEPDKIEYFNSKTKKVELQEVNRRSSYCRDALEAWLAKQPPDALVVTEAIVDRLNAILTACADVERDDARQLQALLAYPGEAEVAAEGEIEGVRFKGRAEKLIQHPYWGRTVIELKSTADSKPSGFSRQIYNMNWDLGIPIYLRLFEAETYVFIVIENGKKSIHPISLFRAGEAMKTRADQRLKSLITLLKRCQDEDRWPAYTRDTEDLELPAWVSAIDNEVPTEGFV